MSDKTPREPLFSKKNRKLVTEPLSENNPITIQVLGICSALAITVQVEQAIVMSLSVLFVMVMGNMIISMLRNLIPSRIRIIVQLVVVASLVIIVNQILLAYMPDIAEKLSVFVGLIITNCIIMGRFEAFAMGNKVWPSLMDGFGNALGYGYILVLVAIFREFFGSGSLSIPGFKWQIIDASNSEWYLHNNLMILPPMALVITGIIIWVQRTRNKSLIEDH